MYDLLASSGEAIDCNQLNTFHNSLSKHIGESLVAFTLYKDSLESVLGLSVLGYHRNGRAP